MADRKQHVVVDGVNSSSISILSGVPQASVLGSYLFLLYVNDLPDVVELPTKVAMYADDAMLTC